MDLRIACLIALALATAGCLSSGPDASLADPPDKPAPESLDLDWGLTDCQAVVAFFDVEPEQVAAHLPDGFEPVSTAQGLAGAGPNPTGFASFGMELFACTSGVGLNGSVESMAYGSYFAFVDPPEELRDPDVDAHFYKWDVLVPDPDRRELLADHGLLARNGSVSFSDFTQAASVAAVEGELEIEGAVHRFSGHAAAPGPGTLAFVEFTHGTDGLVLWRTNAVSSAVGTGSGSVDVADDTLAAEVLGAGPQDAVFIVMTASFEDGSIRSHPES